MSFEILVVTVLAAVYAYTKTPIYEAKALVEIGEYKLNSTTKNSIDDAKKKKKNYQHYLLIWKKI